MKTHILKINVNNLKSEIESNYFKYRDIFYKCLIVNICLHALYIRFIGYETLFEEGHYNNYFQFHINRSYTLESLLNDMDILNHRQLFLDMNLYVSEFIELRHRPKMFNIYSLTIDDHYHIVISNKTIRRIDAH